MVRPVLKRRIGMQTESGDHRIAGTGTGTEYPSQTDTLPVCPKVILGVAVERDA